AHGDGWPGPRVAREPSAMALAAARAARQATNAVSGAGDAVSSAAAGAAGADSAAGGGPAATGRGGRMRNFAKANAEADADSEDAGDGGPRQNAEGGAEDAETRSKVQVWEWVDDLMEGFAELYKLTITGARGWAGRGSCISISSIRRRREEEEDRGGLPSLTTLGLLRHVRRLCRRPGALCGT
ncbi:unnamed protein product, partial [Prorocentrum cordatum]